MSRTNAAVCAAALAAGLLVLAALLYQSGDGSSMPMHDFVEYWAAGRLLGQGQNPYDAELVHELERQAGRADEGILMWNPPWALPLVLPLGALPVRVAHLLWLAVNLAVVGLCADGLWRIYGGGNARRHVALLLACSFVPVYIALVAGQISPLLLLGAVLFLASVRSGRDGWAGAACALLAIKPHLASLFWLAVVLWAVRARRWRVLAGGAAAGVLLALVAVALHPAVFADYWHVMTTSPPRQYRSPTLGMLARLAVGPDASFRWQFLPLLPGLVWFAFHYRRHRARWDWAEQFPLLLLVSVLTTPYGGWPFDLVLLLVPAVRVAALRPRLGTLLAHAAVNGLAFVQLARGVEYLGFVWMTPALLLAYVGLLRLAVDEPAPSAGAA